MSKFKAKATTDQWKFTEKLISFCELPGDLMKNGSGSLGRKIDNESFGSVLYMHTPGCTFSRIYPDISVSGILQVRKLGREERDATY